MIDYKYRAERPVRPRLTVADIVGAVLLALFLALVK